MKEIFKSLWKYTSADGVEYNFNGKISVSNYGKVFSHPRKINRKTMTGYLVSARKTPLGYYQVKLFDDNGNSGWFYVHQLVATAWLKRKPHQNVVMHKDDNPTNNFIRNLKWGTQFDNVNDMVKKGRGRYPGPTKKYSDELVIEIYKKRESGLSIPELKQLYPEVGNYITKISSGLVLRSRNLI